MKDLPLFSTPLSPSGPERKPEVPKPWSVTEFTQRLRGVVEPSFSQVWVQGEVSNYRPAASGHAYFSLKDSHSSLSAAAFSWGAGKKKSFELKDGLQVLCRGKVSIYPPRGGYQLIVEHLEPLGAGALQIAFEKLKAKLAAEGLFSPALKRPLPAFPLRVGIITSPSGAAIQDMLHVLKRRAPQIEILVLPSLMQGDEAPRQVIRALEVAARYRLADVLVVARGGGSIEDLWCFNDEALARAIRQSPIPVISAIGHEIDFTISDFVADLRAPTPSAAAEVLSAHWVEAITRLNETSSRFKGVIQRELLNRKTLLAHIAARLVSPRDKLREQAQKVDELAYRLERSVRLRLEQKKSTLTQCSLQLDALSPLRVLKRGYTLVQDETQGAIIKSAHQIQPGQEMKILFYDGHRAVKAL
ncbi:MAG: exodeoxyribonuclease VII large subunit [Bdellovibrionia bacterium]